MDEVLKIAATQVPSLIVLVLLVSWFLTYLEKDRESRKADQKEAREAHKEALKELASDCHAFQQNHQAKADISSQKIALALEANTRAVNVNTSTLDQLKQTFDPRRPHTA
jgi:hypothetical protein